MATKPTATFVDLPALEETFADSIRGIAFEKGTLRVEFCVTRAGGTPAASNAHQVPSCRLVLPAETAIELANRLQQLMGALAEKGLVKINQPASPPVKGKLA
jgi:hypothetical protein